MAKTRGFSTDGSNVTGFSAIHDSGTGGNHSLGNFPLFPQYCSEDELDSCKFPITARATHYISDSIVATPGYFTLVLNNGIYAEMAAAQRTTLFRFNFPAKHASNGSAAKIRTVTVCTSRGCKLHYAQSVCGRGRMA